MSKRLRLMLVFGCLGVSALHLPRAAHSARAGLRGPYGAAAASLANAASTNPEAQLRLSSNLPLIAQGVGRASLAGEGM